MIRYQRPKKEHIQPVSEHLPVPVLRSFTLRELWLNYRGINDQPIYMAVQGVIYDVSRSSGFYGPEGPYGCFAGRDASRGLSSNTFYPALDETELDDGVPKQVLVFDPVQDLSKTHQQTLDEWAAFFANKYQKVGWLEEWQQFQKSKENE